MADPAVVWNPEKMRELYVEKEMTLEQVAEEGDCTIQTVVRWLNKHGIGTRDRTEAGKLRRKNSATFATVPAGYENWTSGEGAGRDQKSIRVHRLLALVEYEPDELDGMHVHHRNGIKWDNRIENLEVLSPSEHIAYHHAVNRGDEELPEGF